MILVLIIGGYFITRLLMEVLSVWKLDPVDRLLVGLSVILWPVAIGFWLLGAIGWGISRLAGDGRL